jgi:fatty acid desaturase
MFIHELVHLGSGCFTGFRIAWNALCGIPFLMPSFLYYTHVDHHRRKSYGTASDGEYLDLSHRHPVHILAFILSAFVVPFAAIIRFLVLTPIGWLWPALRLWIEQHASSMVIDIFYLRGDFGAKAQRIMRLQELLCFAWCVSLLYAHPLLDGRGLNEFWIQAYGMGVLLILINNVRTLGAHRWTGHGQELSFEDQLLDSVNYPHRAWITELWGPVGTRYHALHHLFPSIPYHNLGKAHRRLMSGLPQDSIYRETCSISLTTEIIALWRRACSRTSQSDNTNHRSPTHVTAA